MAMNVGAYSATGPREVNEDSFYAVDFSYSNSFSQGIAAFIMVSDGMGGYQGGDVASRLAVTCAERYIESLLDMAVGHQIDLDVNAALAEIIEEAHEAITAESAVRGGASMGATFIAAFLGNNHAWIAHVGDSRAYLVREGEAIQLTEDHSQVGRMLSQGIITEHEAQNHPHRNRIERALGFSDARPDFTEVDLYPGDSLVLCSDGVYTVLSSGQVGVCVESAANAENAAQRLVNAALSHNTDDNCTAAVACLPDSTAHANGRKRTKTIRDTAEVRSVRNTPEKRGRHSKGGAASGARQGGSKSARSLVVPAIVFALLVVAAIVVAVFIANPLTHVGSNSQAVESHSAVSASAEAPPEEEGDDALDSPADAESSEGEDAEAAE